MIAHIHRIGPCSGLIWFLFRPSITLAMLFSGFSQTNTLFLRRLPLDLMIQISFLPFFFCPLSVHQHQSFACSYDSLVWLAELVSYYHLHAKANFFMPVSRLHTVTQAPKRSKTLIICTTCHLFALHHVSWITQLYTLGMNYQFGVLMIFTWAGKSLTSRKVVWTLRDWWKAIETKDRRDKVFLCWFIIIILNLSVCANVKPSFRSIFNICYVLFSFL